MKAIELVTQSYGVPIAHVTLLVINSLGVDTHTYQLSDKSKHAPGFNKLVDLKINSLFYNSPYALIF